MTVTDKDREAALARGSMTIGEGVYVLAGDAAAAIAQARAAERAEEREQIHAARRAAEKEEGR